MKFILITLLIAPAMAFATAFPNKEGYKKKIKANMAGFQKCYKAALKTNPELKGEVTLDWDIGDNGKVHRAEAKNSTLNAPEVETCMLEKLKTIRFPPANASQVMTVNYPFSFAPKNSAHH